MYNQYYLRFKIDFIGSYISYLIYFCKYSDNIGADMSPSDEEFEDPLNRRCMEIVYILGWGELPIDEIISSPSYMGVTYTICNDTTLIFYSYSGSSKVLVWLRESKYWQIGNYFYYDKPLNGRNSWISAACSYGFAPALYIYY